jgi:GNAT superfamily N-acetyltransferase
MSARRETIRVERLDASRRADFFRVHAPEHGEGWCCCVAWWTPSWEGWSERSAEENRALREELFDRGEHDGYLLYAEDRPVAWCQVGPRDRLPKLVRRFGLEPDPGAWAVTCFVILPSHRRRGLSRTLLEAVLRDIPSRGAERIEAYPRRDASDAGDLWTGPERIFLDTGFVEIGRHEGRAILSKSLR